MRVKSRNRFTLAVFPLLAGPLIAPTSAIGKPPQPTIKIVDPLTVDPLVREGTNFRAGGPAQHRRIITKQKDGSTNLDVGYNIYAAGMGGSTPYAYNKEELCYISKGEIEIISDGISVIGKAGDLMWRPVGASSDGSKVLKDSVGVCAFSPAREDADSHRIPAADVGKWTGDPALKPRVRWFHIASIAPTERPGNPDYASGKIVERRVLTARKDHAAKADVTFTTYKAGVVLPAEVNRFDTLCWLESGTAEVVTGKTNQTLNATHFLYRPAGARTDSIQFKQDSAMICYASPARTDR
ncbi:hypothetical protein [Sphingobium subterraneum]|uniref:Putative cupin superfamily protein n=1 Tax=Sphingobium subterraneum TaxID=627688 RepID=A0A841IYG0_9SPHN|nr:hypothetical protein [Sphingobium subterraneum]MBB6123703.1 putative cupin superfamily protein [Sphingobium subterraneum]